MCNNILDEPCMNHAVKCVLENQHSLCTDGERFVWSEVSFSESHFTAIELALKGIDMGNGHPEILAIVDEIT